MDKQETQIRLDRITERIAVPFRNRVLREKNRFIRQQANRNDVLAPISDVDFDQHKAEMAKIFERYYRITIRTFSQETVDMVIEKSHPWNLEKKAPFWEFLFRKWITERGAKAATQTAGTTRQDIRDIILSVQENDQAIGRSAVVSRILSVRGLSAFRADTIARTEVGMASSFASIETAKKVGADTGLNLVKQWIPAQDERTRFSHSVMSGRPPISMDAKFIVGGERLDRPRDPAGSAGNIINCRCQLVYEAN